MRSPAAADDLQTSVQYLKGVGPRRAAELAAAGVQTVEDLLLTLPRRYEDRARLQSIRDLRPGEVTSISGTVLSCGLRTTRRPGFRIFEMLVQDASGRVRVAFLNQAFLKDVFAAQQQVVLHGPVDRRPTGGLQITNPDHEIVSDEEDDARGELIHSGRIVPVYEKIGSLTPKSLRRVVHDALQRLPAEVDDMLPDGVRRSLGAPPRRQALAEAHFPAPGTSIKALDQFRTPAQQILILEEFYFFQVGLLLRRRESDTRVKPRQIVVDDRIRQAARDLLPFRLTGHQRQALKEIVEDLQRPRPMNRLLQGDVGSGKTIGGAARGARRHGERTAGGVHGADRDPRGAALREHQPRTGAVALRDRPADRHAPGADAARGREPHRQRRIPTRGGNPRARAGRHPVQGAGPRHHRRTASLRCRAACDSAREGPRPGCARNDRDPDSTHPGPDRIR